MIKINIPVAPRTKKNSQRIVLVKSRPIIMPSKLYKDYEKECGKYLEEYKNMNINEYVNVKVLYYMPTKRRVDLVNLLEATDDILTHYKVLEDDNSNIIVSHDGSRVHYDKENPRCEIIIEKIKEQE